MSRYFFRLRRSTFPLHAVLAGTGFLFATAVAAHDEPVHCEAVKASISDAGFGDKVSVSCTGDQVSITSDTYPDHDVMTGIEVTNEQLPIPANYTAAIPASPSLRLVPITRDAALGVAVNGVPIYDYTGGGEMTEEDLYHHQRQHDTLETRQLDVCGGHAGRGDDYHYHVKPTCMIEQMANAGDDAVIGWAFDGFPIYGDNNPDGTSIAAGTLDVCNGQEDDTYGYRYHTSETAPYIVQCLMGEVESVRSLPRVAPLTSATGDGSRKAGKPPKGGVQDLTFIEDESGVRRMDYTYQGEAYYMQYRPTDKANCFAFETRTVTESGVVKTGEYCR